MADSFSTVEKILEFAIFRESEANQLYVYMAAHVTTPEMRKVCEDFAKEELDHKAKLKSELTKIGEVVTDLSVSNYVVEVKEPIEMNYAELLVFAINNEDKSINLYRDLAKRIKDKESRKVLLSLVQDEIEHKQRFESEYNNLQKKK